MQFLGTIVTVVGIFLGLYFTAVSAVAGGLFMPATGDLRELFLRHQKSQGYIRTLGLTIIVGIYYLGLGTIGYEFSIVGLIAIVVLTSYAVIRLVSVGFRAFYFIHPTEASATITSDTAHAINSSSVGGFGWKRDYLQNHYSKQAAGSLNTLRSLINYCVDAIRVSDEQLVTVARYSDALLSYYLTKKKQIPTESHWHATTQEFQNWILADSTDLALALNTGTSLSPKIIKDKNWFEERCLDTVLNIFDHFVEKERWESAHICVEILVSSVESVGRDLYDDTAQLLFDKIAPKIKQAIAAIDSSSSPEERQFQLEFVGSYGRLGIALLIGFLRHVSEQKAGQLYSEIASTDWTSDVGVSRSKLPGKLLPALEKSQAHS